MQVLGLEEGASETVVRRQFRRLAHQVHPDKTHCFGAESAFKLISKAASIVTPRASGGAAGEYEYGNMLMCRGCSAIHHRLFCLRALTWRHLTLEVKHSLLLRCPESMQYTNFHSMASACAV